MKDHAKAYLLTIIWIGMWAVVGVVWTVYAHT